MSQKYMCVIDENNNYVDFVLMLPENPQEENADLINWKLQYYKLKDGQKLVESLPPNDLLNPVWNGENFSGELIIQPETTELSPTELREIAYNTEEIILFDDEYITVTQASNLWCYYCAENNTTKADELSAAIITAKTEIRNRETL